MPAVPVGLPVLPTHVPDLRPYTHCARQNTQSIRAYTRCKRWHTHSTQPNTGLTAGVPVLPTHIMVVPAGVLPYPLIYPIYAHIPTVTDKISNLSAHMQAVPSVLER